MAILTKPKFFYIESVTNTNNALNFSEGGPEFAATVASGGFAVSELASAVATAMTSAGGQIYSVVFNRSDNTITISAPGNFELLPVTGSNIGTSIFPLLGFTTDRTGSNSYISDTTVATEYVPQFPLQDYRGFIDRSEAISASINETPSNVVETITFGTVSRMSFNIKYIKDGQPCSDSIYGNDPNAVSNARAFLDFITTKARLEFMEDKNNPSIFDIILHDSNSFNSQGVGYFLEELYSENLIGYYQTGNLVFRKI